MPFLRLTRDRRGFENTFLLHADHPGAKPRLLYWYRTAPGIGLGRPPLDEDAIRTIEEHHPDIDFDWPAILALSEVMTPEEEAPAPRPQQQQQRRDRRPKSRDRDRAPRDAAEERPEFAASDAEEVRQDQDRAEEAESTAGVETDVAAPFDPVQENIDEPRRDMPRGLVDDLAGREVARALRARYSEIKAKIDQVDGDRGAWLSRLEAINPDAWLTPEAVLHGVSNAGAAYEKLKAELAPRQAPPEAGQS